MMTEHNIQESGKGSPPPLSIIIIKVSRYTITFVL